MPKKFKGVNTKAEAARERKATAKAEEDARRQKAAEDEYWRDDDKHAARKQLRKVRLVFRKSSLLFGLAVRCVRTVLL